MSEQNTDVAKLTTCQKCGANDPNLTPIESGLRLALSKSGVTEIPQHVCSPCLKELRKSASQGAQLQAKQEAKSKQKGDLWRNRTQFVRQGRLFLNRAEYAEAAVAYEKYLKVVQVVTQKDRKDLDPKQFNEHPKEITIIASVLWDLMLIYDSHLKFLSRQQETAEILARFLRFSPVYNSIIRKAEKEVRKARNPAAFKLLLRLCDVQSARCFIANATFETRTDPTVVSLCLFRDQILKNSPTGRFLVATYYKISPAIARKVQTSPTLRAFLRPVLRRVAIMLSRIFNLPGKPIS